METGREKWARSGPVYPQPRGTANGRAFPRLKSQAATHTPSSGGRAPLLCQAPSWEWQRVRKGGREFFVLRLIIQLCRHVSAIAEFQSTLQSGQRHQYSQCESQGREKNSPGRIWDNCPEKISLWAGSYWMGRILTGGREDGGEGFLGRVDPLIIFWHHDHMEHGR